MDKVSYNATEGLPAGALNRGRHAPISNPSRFCQGLFSMRSMLNSYHNYSLSTKYTIHNLYELESWESPPGVSFLV